MQKHLNKSDMINLGAFYTPHFIVDLAYDMLHKYVDLSEYLLLDSACGYGDFFSKNYNYIGADIDSKALQICKERFIESKINLIHTNSLHNITRKKFNISENENLIIIGNPPYNDKTSLLRNTIKDVKYEIDSNLKSRDLGISFMRSFVLLNPAYICVLHPLSYLIKESNFKALQSFSKSYKLLDGLVISSSHFSTAKTHFPILIGLYERGSMDYLYIKNFTFKTFEGATLQLSKFDFISNYITKYPNPKDNREAVAYFHTLRDINALKRNKTFKDKLDSNTIRVFKDNLAYYCYIHHFKDFAKRLPYYFGNLEPFINHNEFIKIKEYFINLDSKNEKIQRYFESICL